MAQPTEIAIDPLRWVVIEIALTVARATVNKVSTEDRKYGTGIFVPGVLDITVNLDHGVIRVMFIKPSPLNPDEVDSEMAQLVDQIARDHNLAITTDLAPEEGDNG